MIRLSIYSLYKAFFLFWSLFFFGEKILFLFFFFFGPFRVAPAACGSSQTRGRIGTVTAGPHYSHSSSGSELHLRLTPQLCQCGILNPLRPEIEATSSWILGGFLTHGAATGTSIVKLLLLIAWYMTELFKKTCKTTQTLEKTNLTVYI